MQHSIQRVVKCVLMFVCCVICSENSSFAALSHSDNTVRNLMCISPRNVMSVLMSIMSPTAQHLPATHNCSHNSVCVLYTYILMLSIPFTVLVLLVCKYVHLFAAAETQNVNTP